MSRGLGRGWSWGREDIYYFSHEKREMMLNERYDINDRVTYFVLLVRRISLLLRFDISKRRHHNENFKYRLTLSPISHMCMGCTCTPCVCVYLHSYEYSIIMPCIVHIIYCSCSACVRVYNIGEDTF